MKTKATEKIKILLVANSSWYLFNFRLSLLKDIKNSGFSLELLCPLDEYTNLLLKEGFIVHTWKVNRASINPFTELKSLINIIFLYRKIKPNLSHHFTIKACLYGTIAAKLSNTKFVINAITGLGPYFYSKKFHHLTIRLILKPIYRVILKSNGSNIIFQNQRDLKDFTSLGISNKENFSLIKSSGVDIDYYKPSSGKSLKYNYPTKLLFPARIIREKGIIELCQSCRILWSKGFNFELLIAGSLDKGNRTRLTEKEIKILKNHTNFKLLGHISDMKSLYESIDIVVLPSWREGLSKALIESAAMGLPIITSDIAGCNDVVDNGISGILVPVKDVGALVLAIDFLLKNPEIANKFGKAARKKVSNEYNINLVNSKTIKKYNQIMNL